MFLKALMWVGSSKDDVQNFPEEIRGTVGFALYLAQKGERHEKTKILKGFGGARVIEILEDDASGTYRTVYTVMLKKAVYVLHAFQKKSKQGIKTSKRDMELIEKRLKTAKAIDAE